MLSALFPGIGTVVADSTQHNPQSFSSAGIKSSAFASTPFSNSPYWSVPYWSVPYWSVPYWSVPYWSVPYWSVPYWSVPYWSVPYENSPYWSVPYWSVPYWSVPYENSPYWSVPYWSVPYWSVPYENSPYWSVPYWSVPYWSVPYWSVPYWSVPYWSVPYENSPYWSVPFESTPFWSVPYWSVPYWSVPYWSVPYWSVALHYAKNWDGSTTVHQAIKDLKTAISDLKDARNNMVDMHRSMLKWVNDLLKHPEESNFSVDTLKTVKSELKQRIDSLKSLNTLFKDLKATVKSMKNLSVGSILDIVKGHSLPSWANLNPETPWGVQRVLHNKISLTSSTGSGVNIAVLDSGIDASHPDLAGQVVWSKDFTGTGLTDVSGHGTHVAGTIAALKNGQGVVGVAPGAKLYSMKVVDGTTGKGEYSWATQAIYAAVRGPDGVVGTKDDANIISMSFDTQGEVPPQSFHTAIQFAYSHNVALVAAAGNNGDGNTSTLEPVSYPGAYPEVIAVGSSNIKDQVSVFSNTESYLEVVAPGEMIFSTFKDSSYALWAGTSMATPHVTGVIAILISQYGHLPVGTFSDTGSSTLRGLLHTLAYQTASTAWTPYNGYGVAQI